MYHILKQKNVSLIGKYADLKVVKLVDFGVYLLGEDETEILLPIRYVPENTQLDDTIKVFIYRDSEDRVIATTEKPYAIVGEFAWLRAKAVTNVGAFLDWGLMKDLLCPFREQKMKMEEGRSYLVYVYVDEKTGRIAATAKLEQIISNFDTEFTEGQEVSIMIGHQSDLGYSAIIDNQGMGILYNNEIFGAIREGDVYKAWVKKVREDGKIDLSLQQQGYHLEVPRVGEELFEILKKENGFLPLNDKSSPEEIYDNLQMSKKNFKKVIGLLYKQRIITIEKDGIHLVKSEK
ncbi:CvfB family protein [Ancylomarina euxinus]|uniref:CvfB family protein n=1 Tax=Ancylomarina euxinus TaxID=2283627 RepID=UPI0012E1F40B|nr:S1-like domain-containing RNA-binding protein [Ancylomarina euxinus]MCZ4694818.1 S1-like domain-containing RNA-binding protein [Ancylomarina euxinus]